MQVELEKGASLDDIRKRITKGETQPKVSTQQEKKRHFSTDRIQRKKRDITSLLTKFASTPVEENVSVLPEVLSTVQQFSRVKEDNIDGPIANKKIYKLGDKELLVSTQYVHFT